MRLALALVLAGFAAVAGAVPRISSNVSSESPIYDIIDRLESRRCALPTLRVFGPQTWFDLRTAVDVGETPPDDESDEEAKRARCDLPRWLRKERDLLLRPIQPLSVSATPLFLHNDALPLLGTEAFVTPLLPMRAGRPFFNGPDLQLELEFGGEMNRPSYGFAAGITPGFITGLEQYNSLRGKFYIQEGYLKVGFKWLDVTFGRQALAFGRTGHGSMLLTQAAKPIDLIKLSLRPHIVGTPFSFLGPFTFETWVSFENTSKLVDGSHFWGIGLGIRPLTWLELAVLELYQFGGTGAPGLQLGDMLKMLVYLDDDQLAQKRQRAFGFHLAIWGPSQIFKLYTQLYFEEIASLSSFFSDDVSPLVGLWFPRIGEADLRFEFVHTVPNAYKHPFWKQGLSWQSTPLGHPIGPDAQGFYLDLGLPPIGDVRVTLGASYEARLLTPGAGQATDYRYGGGLEIRGRLVHTELAVFARYNHATNDQYVPNNPQDSAAGYAMVRYTFF